MTLTKLDSFHKNNQLSNISVLFTEWAKRKMLGESNSCDTLRKN